MPTAGHGGRLTALQQLLLRAAVLEDDAARAASSEWRARVDLDRIDPESFQLLPLMYRAMRRRGEQWHDMDRLRGVARQSWSMNRLLIVRLAELVDTLEQQGIQTLLLARVPLRLSSDKDIGERPLEGVELAVRDAAAPRFLPTVRAAGWTLRDSRASWPPRFVAACTFTGPLGLELVLHSRILHESTSVDDDDVFWDAAQAVEVEGVATRLLNPADHLLQLAVQGCRWSAPARLRWIAEAAMVLLTSGSELDWGRLTSQAQSRQLARVTGRALLTLKAVLGLAIPDDVVVALTGGHHTCLERVECWGREGPGLLRTAAATWSDFSRSAGREPDWSGPLGFPRYVRDRMGLTAVWQVPAAVARRFVHQGH